MQRGRDLVTLRDGQQAKLSTVSVEVWHTGMEKDCRMSLESLGQFYEDATYAIRWTYRLSATGKGVCVCVRRPEFVHIQVLNLAKRNIVILKQKCFFLCFSVL